MEAHGANYLGPEHDGVPLSLDPTQSAAVAPARRPASIARSRRPSSSCSASSTACRPSSIPDDPAHAGPHQVLRAGLPHAAGVPEVFEFDEETAGDADALRPRSRATRRSAAIAWRPAGWSSAACASCRSIHGSNGGAGGWDAHGDC